MVEPKEKSNEEQKGASSSMEVEKLQTDGERTQWMVCETIFNIDNRYEIIDPMGQGAYGMVVAAKDNEAEDPDNNLVAIKKIERAFDHKVFLQRTLRELKI